MRFLPLARPRGERLFAWFPALAAALLACAFADGPVRAQAPAPPSAPALAEVLAYALEWNPDVVAARLRVDSARGEQRIARSLPNPSFTAVPGNPFQYQASENLDVGPGRLFRTRAAGRAAAAAGRDVDDVARTVTFNVRQGFFDLLLAERVRLIAGEQLEALRQLLAADSLRFRQGDLAQKDVAATELAWAHGAAVFARSAAAARAARMNLQLLMGVPRPDTAFSVRGELSYRRLAIPFDSLPALARAHRPDLAAADLRVQQGKALRSLATSELLPMPALAGVYQPNGPDGTKPFANGSNYAVGLSFSLPVFYWFGGERQRAAASLRTARVASERAAIQARSDVTLAGDNFQAAQELAERYASGLLDRARAALEMQRFAYEHGNASLLDVLNAINAFADTQTDYFTALHDYWVSAYAIDEAVGADVVP